MALTSCECMMSRQCPPRSAWLIPSLLRFPSATRVRVLYRAATVRESVAKRFTQQLLIGPGGGLHPERGTRRTACPQHPRNGAAIVGHLGELFRIKRLVTVGQCLLRVRV